MPKQLQKEMTQHLKDTLLPFWMRLRDARHGGYTGYVGYDLTPDAKAAKGCILNSRILWFFATAARVLSDDTPSPYAQHAYAMLKERFADPVHGGLYWSVTYDGQPQDTTKHTYCQAFGIYALSAYYRLTNDPEALDAARALYTLIETKCSDGDGGYLEALDESFHPIANEKLSDNGVDAAKTMNTLLHIMEAYTELYIAAKDVAVRQRLSDILHIFRDQVYSAKDARMEVFFDAQMHSLLDMQSYGHDIEASWLIDRALDALGDDALTASLRPITLALADSVHGRGFTGRCLLNESVQGTVDQTRVWWVQAEGVVGFMNAFSRTAEPRFADAANALWQYIQASMVDPRPGSEWFWATDANDAPLPRPIVEPWKCPYHNGRMCLEIIEHS